LNSRREAANALDEAIKKGGDVKAAQEAYDLADKRLNTYIDNTQKGRTEWSNAGRAMQEEAALDFANHDEVLLAAQRAKGGKLNTKTETELKDLSTKLEEAEARVKELEDALTDDSLPRPKRNKRKTTEQLETERVAAVGRLKEALKNAQSVAAANPVEPFVEVGKAIRDLGFHYLEKGYSKLEDVILKIKEDFPDLTDREIRDAISKYGQENAPRTVKEATKQKNDLVKEARLLSQIEDAAEGIYRPGVAPGKASPRIKALIAELDKLLKDQGIRRVDTETDKLERLKKALEDLKAGIDTPRRGRAPDSEAVSAIRDQIKDIRDLKRYEESIADMRRQLDSGDLKVKERVTKQRTQAIEDAKFDADQLRKEIQRKINAQKPKGVGHYVAQAFGVPRSLLTATGPIDYSWVLRQALIPSISHPIQAARAIGAATKAGWSNKSAYVIEQAIKKDPVYMKSQRSGLELGELFGSANRQEEFLASGWAEAIPGYGQMVKSSERNMTTGLNHMRFNLFKDFVKKFPDATEKELKVYAAYLNNATGRGNLGNFKMAASDLSAVLFSARLNVSRVATPFYALGKGKSLKVTRQAAKDLASTVGVGLAVIHLAKMNGAEAPTDPDDSDFGKIVIDGDIHIDIWGGYQPVARMYARVAKGVQEKIDASSEGRDPKGIPDAFDLIAQVMKYKIGPGPRGLNTLLTGKDAVGNKRTPLDVLETSVLPITVEEVIETAKEKGLWTWESGLSGGGSLAGLGVSVYE
ncbi:MAG: hypothetical protein M3Q91_18615, partial [Acidobacteriota bacterium]|nr:hypothetical protein [Acidobacteriota bacterium]